jgi:hypothetical protein
MQLKKMVYLSALLVLGLALSAQASTIGNGPPNQSGGSDLNSYLEADNFNSGGNTGITHVQFWALATGLADFTGTVDWGFYTDAAGAPGAAVASGNSAATMVATGAPQTLGLNEYAVNFDVSVPVAMNTVYWLVLHNGPSSDDPNNVGSTFYWAWHSTAKPYDSVNQALGDTAWIGNDAELAFQVTAVPEPASLSLIAGGLITGWMKRRKLIAKN